MVIEKGGRCLYDPNRGRISTAFEIAANMQTQRVYKKVLVFTKCLILTFHFIFASFLKKVQNIGNPAASGQSDL